MNHRGKWTSRLAALAIIALGSFGLIACSGEPSGGGGKKDTGSVEVELQIGDVELSKVSYTISGNGYHKEGELPISGQTVSGRVDGIPAGTGYLLNLTALGEGVDCSGSATFDVVAGQTTSVSIVLNCRVDPRTGGVLIDGRLNLCPVIDFISANPAKPVVGESTALTTAAVDLDSAPAALTYAWTASTGSLSGQATAAPSLTCAAVGDVLVELTVADGDCETSASIVVSCVEADEEEPVEVAVIRVNEMVSTGGIPGDWVELYNASDFDADLSGWTFKDDDDGHAYRLPAGSIIPAKGFFVLDEAAFGFGLGKDDTARIFDLDMNLVDSFTQPAHGSPSWGRCPDGTGAFVMTSAVTKGAPNACLESGSMEFLPWPGQSEVIWASSANQFGNNLSGLFYEGQQSPEPSILWATLNSPSKIYRMSWNSGTSTWTDTPGWTGGRLITYLSGSGNPDSEGITRAELDQPGIYVATERNNDQSSTSRPTILRYDVSSAASPLVATNEWALIADLPVLGANLGPEAIAWIPDSFLLQRGFVDESKGRLYDPNDYPNHGTGIFVVGMEQDGVVYAYVLNHADNSFTRVATIESGFDSVMDLSFDRDVGYLWAYCDNTCDNKATILDIDTDAGSPTFGKFQVLKGISTPTALPNSNFEGIGIAPESECVNGYKTIVWSDDDQAGGISLRQGTIACGRF